MTLKTLRDLFEEESAGTRSLENCRVFVRVDYNVPCQEGKILDTTRIEATLPTLRSLLERGAKVLLLSHFGRPKGAPSPSLSLRFLLPVLSDLVNQKSFFYEGPLNKSFERFVHDVPSGSLILLENIRFHPEEESNESSFSASLASYGDIYINDAYSASHRPHSSVVGLPKHLPRYAGSLFQKEYTMVQQAVTNPKRPLMALVAGSKVSTKLSLLESLMTKADKLVLGGGIANTFLVAQGYSLGSSLVEQSMIETAKRILDKAPTVGCDLLLPHDLVGAVDFEAPPIVVKPGLSGSNDPHQIPKDFKAFDVGPQTILRIQEAMQAMKTVVWNGPLGVFEHPPYDAGTKQVAQTLGRLTQEGVLTSIAGGGETGAALDQAGVKDQLSGLSLAGGAFLEALEGKELPGVLALDSPEVFSLASGCS